MEAMEADEAVKATTSTDELYLDSYERYAGTSSLHLAGFAKLWKDGRGGRKSALTAFAENRPDTSQLQKAVDSGRGLP